MHPSKSNFFAITSFYNPAQYKRRLLNYQKFRALLQAPLLTVELSFNGQYMLNQQDANILIQVQSQSHMWQKERLLNIAIRNLPPEVQYVAWIDCDILFGWNSWIQDTIEALNKHVIIQPFERMYDLEKDKLPELSYSQPNVADGFSFAYHLTHTESYANNFKPVSSKGFRYCACGLAWAARVEFIKKHNFYDAMIVGSGDRMLAFAAAGKFEEAITTTRLSESRAKHYLSWAEPIYEEIQGNIGFLKGSIYHLWHGDLNHRGWVNRHADLAEIKFDPEKDLKLNADECWEWASDNPALQNYMHDYFFLRHEDGL